MDITSLKKVIASHTPINSRASLPIEVELNGETQIRWFIYDVDVNNQKNIEVTRICTLDSHGRVDVKMVDNCTFEYNNELSKETVETYIARFVDEYNKGDKKAMDALITDIQTEEMLELYGAVSIVEALQ